LLQRNPSLAVGATEECLRYDPPVKSLQRLAEEDVELRGKVIRKLDRVRWFITAANRDPQKFPEPDRFDITRDPNVHVAFGSGIHHCLGATLARIEGQEAFQALVERSPTLHAETDDFEYQPSLTFRSLKSLPVTWK
jgi:pimeloyl-[acyl-carrier protein] synthase